MGTNTGWGWISETFLWSTTFPHSSGKSHPFHFATIPTHIHNTPSTAGITVLPHGTWGKATLAVKLPFHIFVVNSGN